MFFILQPKRNRQLINGRNWNGCLPPDEMVSALLKSGQYCYNSTVLLVQIISKAKYLQKELAEKQNKTRRSSTTVQTSHFYVPRKFEKYLSTLELNYIITKYYEQSSRSGEKVSIYALNHGLCIDNNIAYGRPKGDRKYYITRSFDYSSIVESFLETYKVYTCDNCGHEYSFDDFEIVQKANDVCFQGCRNVASYTEVLTFADAPIAEGLAEEDRLPEFQYDVLVAIDEIEDPFATPISQELDCFYQMVNAATKKLVDKQLVTREDKKIDGKNRKIYHLTPKAQKLYLSN